MTRRYPALCVEPSTRSRADNENDRLSFVEFLSINRGADRKSQCCADKELTSPPESCRHRGSLGLFFIFQPRHLSPPVRTPAARRRRDSKVSRANSDRPVGS